LLDLEAHRLDVGLQQWRALLALGSGGLFGHGLGNGREKMFYMPFAHTDFIFPMIGEELGLVGTLTIVVLFVVFIIFGMLVAMNAPDDFGRVFGAGIVVLVAVQAAMNIGVTTAVLPNTGLPLPFVSYGGSSLVCTMAIVGILVNIYRQGRNPDREPSMRVRRPRVTPRIWAVEAIHFTHNPSIILKESIKNKTVVIACGGTGGHLFPGIAVAEALLDSGVSSLLLVSGKDIDSVGRERYSDLQFKSLAVTAKPPLFSRRFPGFVFGFVRTFWQCWRILRGGDVGAVLGMGGFTSLVPMRVGRWLGKPVFLHESNAVPGRVNRISGRIVDKVFLGVAACAGYFAGREVEVTGTPVRGDIFDLPGREEACVAFGLDPGVRTLLVIGGSQGARALNRAVVDACSRLAPDALQLLLLSGNGDYREAKAYAEHHLQGRRFHVAAFCPDMAKAYAASDLVLARSGASTLSELAVVGLPALLVPYPYAADDHQTANAMAYVDVGAARMLPERSLDAETLAGELRGLIRHSGELGAMGDAMRCTAYGDSARRIADSIIATMLKEA